MNRKLMFALLVLAVLLAGCNRNVPTASATATPNDPEPIAVPTDSPTAVPTEEPTATVKPTEIPSPTPTPTPVSLSEWTAANGFQQMGGANEQYYEKRTGRISFWVQEYREPEGVVQFREVAVRIPNSTAAESREEALNVWTEYLSELFIPAVAERVSGLTLDPGEETDIFIGGSYYAHFVVLDMGRGDTAFVVTVSVPPPPIIVDPYLYLLESVEVVAGDDCLAVIPAGVDLGSEEFSSWMEQYLDRLSKEALGEEHPFSPDSEIFFLPPDTPYPTCVVILHRDATNGGSFLVYETAGEVVVRVPFTPP